MPNGDSAQYGSAIGKAISRGHASGASARLVGLGPAARDRRRRGRGRRRRARPSTPACTATSCRPRAAGRCSASRSGTYSVSPAIQVDGTRRRADLDVEHVAGQAHAADGGVEQLGLDARASASTIAPVPTRSRSAADVPAEGAGAVVVLAVDVGGDGAAQRDERRAGRHRHEPAARQEGAVDVAQRRGRLRRAGRRSPDRRR